jgi:four helix bundle protein
MKNNIIRDKSYQFAVRIVNLYRYLNEEKKEYVLSKQLLRCGTSVGAIIRESEHAESKADFVHKIAIAQKEINEAIYWIELLKDTNFISETEFISISIDAIEIIKILTSISKTTKNNISKK